MEKFVKFLMYGISKLPFPLLYILSDFLFFISFYLLKYRREVVEENLRHAFPQKTEKQIQDLSKEFFKELADMVLETVKLLSISEEELLRRCRLEDSEGVRHLMQQKKGAMVLTAHLANWEWGGQVIGLTNPQKSLHVVYLKLKNKMFNKIMLDIRNRFGNKPVHMEQAFRHIYNHKGKGIITGFVADQTPQLHQAGLWAPFMGRMAPFFTGPEKIAVRLNQAVYFGWVKKVKRGYYDVGVQLITEDAANMPEHAITETYIRLLENKIKEAPHSWLWSHRRWKHVYKGTEEAPSASSMPV